MIINLFKWKISKNIKFKILTYFLNVEIIEKPIFLAFSTEKFYNCLKQAFIKALIFQYFD